LTSFILQLAFPFLPLTPDWREGSCPAELARLSLSRPPVPCFMHEDDGAVIYSSRGDHQAPVSASESRSCTGAAGGQVRFRAGPA
jgi:hypothetical protein